MVDDRSTRELMTVAKFAFVVMTVGALIAPIPANSQLVGGVFGARARAGFGGTNGFGAELGVSLPLVPLEVFAAGTLFRPGCTGCDFKIWSVGAKLQIFPLPVLKPYVTVGRTWRDLEDPGAALILADDGFFTGAGLEFALPGFGLFAEGRYEFLPEDPGPSPDLGQSTMRVGLRMRWGGIPL